MKRNLTLAVASQFNQDHEVALATMTGPGTLPGNGTAIGRLGRAAPMPVTGPGWEHTLILTGTLDHRSAPDLEDEVECLCEEGVTSLTLDCTSLEGIDTVGVNTITFLEAQCRSRGSRLLVGSAPAAVQEAFLVTGAAAPAGAMLGGGRRFDRSAERRNGRRTTSMIKPL